ncbi:glucosylceramidase [Mucilaginibacter yixingensis]|uniref:Glucosylceramidase n=1 Tax=Mucilaginibacter yixingensis TaxID=1295612 RepID=A0A2T5JDW0_9SPHI|nr:glycoside hydrolase family 30 beta sandwich domain-containing protein [Mucilaginibacter yixingensis]PTQ99960.1 glucosylceramidase [Mucilaginibacter yixingensis]
MKSIKIYGLAVAVLTMLLWACSKKSVDDGPDSPVTTQPTNPTNPTNPLKSDVALWLTTADKSQLFAKQSTVLNFAATGTGTQTINVDSTVTYQTIDGFGFALTGGSATLLNSLAEPQKTDLLQELFGTADNAIGISYIRITIGASDMSAAAFSYDDVPGDVSLTNFSLDKEKADLIPILQKIIAINPNIKILACPWSAPAWMKTSNSFTGGSLKPENYGPYANYFVKYIQGMKAAGITIDAITPQNEPLNEYNTPAMLFQSADEGAFIKNNLGPAFQAAGISTKIIIYDHNADHPEYATNMLADAATANFVDGSAFHLYGGNVNAIGPVHTAYPAKNLYFTEQATFAGGSFSGDLNWHVGNLVVGATRNWCRNVIEWNLASDPNYGPHTTGGCSTCLGAVTIGSSVARNVSYYIIAHASKFVRPGAVRINSDQSATLLNVAFKNASGSKVLIVLNNTSNAQTFNIKYGAKIVTSTLTGGAVGTYVWN